MLNTFLQVIRRDLLLAVRQKADVLNTLFFFVVVVTIVPLGIGPEPNLLRSIAPGVVWVAALLAAILSLPRLFANDHADGTLEQMLLSAEPLPLIVLGKAVAHWLVTGLPLTTMSLVFGVAFDLGLEETFVMVISLALGTPVLSLIGAVGAALTLGSARRRSANIVARSAALYSGADLRFGGGGCSGHQRQLFRVSPPAGCLSAVCDRTDAVARRHRAAHIGGVVDELIVFSRPGADD